MYEGIKMQAYTKTFRELLDPNSTQFVIPFFQRGFVWKKDNWAGLFRDVLAAINSKQNLFIGAIVLKEKDQKQHIVIDGQQRLTTLCILASVISLINKSDRDTFKIFFIDSQEPPKSEKPILVQSHQSEKDFDMIMKLDKLEDFSEVENPSNVIDAYEYFRKELDKLDEIPSIANFIQAVKFVRIDLDPGEDEQKIFDTINSLGIRLTTADLLKNYLFESNQLDIYNKTWGAEFEQDQESIDYWENDLKTGRLNKKNIDLFLYYYLQIVYFRDRSIRRFEDVSDDKSIRKKDMLFSNYKKYIEKFAINKKEFVNDLIKYAKEFKSLVQNKDEDLPNKAGLDRLNYIILNLDCSTVIPYILYISLEVDDECEKNKIYEYIESYLMRRLLSGAKNTNYSDLFTENLIGSGIDTYDKLQKYISDKNYTDALSIPSDESIKFYLKNNEFKNDRARAIMYLIESSLRSNKMCTKLHKLEDYTLEHLMPKKWKRNWTLNKKYNEEERNRFINTLGNMGLITQSLNSSISNACWSVKIQGSETQDGLKKCASGILTMQSVLKKENWDEDCIAERSDFLSNEILKLWSLTKEDE